MSYETNDKMVSHPDHYKSGKFEVIDILDEFCKDLKGTECICTANALKYILRWKKKNGIQDVKKAIWYLTHLVEHLENKEREEHAEFDEELLKKRKEFVDKALNHIRENSVYGIPKECSEEENKLEPGCDKCEISECKFLEDPFMNPPYNVLWDKWKEQKETIKKLMNDKKEMQDSIDFLEDDKKLLKECNGDLIKANDDLFDKLFKANKENTDLKKKMLKMSLKIKEEN